jgi:hypothetical protein
LYLESRFSLAYRAAHAFALGRVAPDRLSLGEPLPGFPMFGEHRRSIGPAALSDVEYTVTVTDTESGAQRTHRNARGVLASVADTNAF